MPSIAISREYIGAEMEMLVAIQFLHYDIADVHKTLRVTLIIGAGISDSIYFYVRRSRVCQTVPPPERTFMA
jgi:hypothetical protein